MNVKILIVGAGAAGIAAATRLYENGFKNVHFLEATDRIGGRVNTVSFGENVVDLGAQWCHGEKNNVVYELAGPLGLLESSIVSKGNVLVKCDGEVVRQDITDRMMDLAEGTMNSDEFAKYNGTLGDFVTERFMKGVLEEQMHDIDRELVQQFLAYYHNYQKGYIAIDSWYDLTAFSLADYDECEGDLALSWKGKGYKSVLDLLMKKHPTQNNEPIPIERNILFNKFVTNICWNKGPDNPLTVTCADGTQYEANHIILTASIGVLKENIDQLFTPRLPIMKRNAINGINFGTVNKVIMEFETPFWTEMGNTFGLLWDKDELKKLRSSKYAWTEGVSTFFKVDHQPKLLVAWMIAEESRQTELLEDEEVISGIMFLLKKFFKGKQIEEPVKMIRSKWSTDRNFRGSYSSQSLTTEMLKTGPDDLATPLTDCLGTPVLLFAGEATNRQHYGTVHGATASGWREADRIIKLYANKLP